MTRSEWRKRKMRGSTSWIRKNTRFAIYARDGFRCLLCPPDAFEAPAYDGRGLTLDHIRPRALGGSNAPENLFTCCYPCNSARQHKLLPHKVRKPIQQHALRVKLNRELGTLYAELYRKCRDGKLTHPLTGNIVEAVKISFNFYGEESQEEYEARHEISIEIDDALEAAE